MMPDAGVLLIALCLALAGLLAYRGKSLRYYDESLRYYGRWNAALREVHRVYETYQTVADSAMRELRQTKTELHQTKVSFARFAASRARLERRCLQAERGFVRVSRELRYLRELREDAE
jgi:ATP-dependent helicase YprA (DUF1998 family)